MNRILKEATVRRYQHGTHQQLRARLQAFLDAYNFAKRQDLNGLTSYESVCKAWTEEPDRFHTIRRTSYRDRTSSSAAYSLPSLTVVEAVRAQLR